MLPLAGIVSAGLSVYQAVAGSSTKATHCSAQASDAQVLNVLRNASPAEIMELRRLYLAANPRSSWPQPPSEIAFSAAGGDDCRATSDTGKAYQLYFNGLVARYGGGTPPQAPLASAGFDPGDAQVGGAQAGSYQTTGGGSSPLLLYLLGAAVVVLIWRIAK